MKRQKVKIEVIPDDEEGDIDLAALESMLADGHRKAALIAITHAPTSSGDTLICLVNSTATMRARLPQIDTMTMKACCPLRFLSPIRAQSAMHRCFSHKWVLAITLLGRLSKGGDDQIHHVQVGSTMRLELGGWPSSMESLTC